jgi:hypothetical protein
MRRLLALPGHCRLARKILEGTNTLAYFSRPTETREKKFNKIEGSAFLEAKILMD